MNKLEFYMIHFMPYPFIPRSDTLESTWVNLSNSYYDPEIGYRLYQDYLDLFLTAEKLGYDGILVNEHHQNAYGTMPAPNLMAAWLTARTQRIPIGIIGNALPLHKNPLRVAEEIAMLDVMSGGRIISGFVLGTGNEYHSYSENPTFSRERFWEAHDLILKAWTDDGPFTWQGDQYFLNYVNPWPKPLQRPHPPIWIPGFASLETIDACAKRRYTFMQVFSPSFVQKQAYDLYRRLAEEKYGYEVDRRQLGATIATYVAENDAQAHREAKAHLMWLFRTGLKHPSYFSLPAGYMSRASLTNMLATYAKYDVKEPCELEYEELIERGYVIVGGPETVVERLTAVCDELGAGVVVGAGGQVGAMPKWMAEKNMTIMAEEVMPHFRDGGKPVWADRPSWSQRTRAEQAVNPGQPELPPLAEVEPGRFVDVRTAHVPELAARPGDSSDAEATGPHLGP